MGNKLISKENIVAILKPIKERIKEDINSKDITEEQKELLNKSEILQTDSNNALLSDDGIYKEVDLSKIESTIEDTNKVIDLFGIEKGEEKWETKSKMSVNRRELASSIYEDKIYCIGGRDSGNSYSNTNECYNVTTNTWETKKVMPTGRKLFTSCIYGDKIYCIGGYGSNGYLTTNECYNVLTDTWETKLEMPTSRRGLTSSIYQDKIYCIGGYNDRYLNINECYNVSTNTWETKLEMFTSRRELTSSIYKDKIYVIGGRDSNNYFNTNECYNISTNTWETKLVMSTKRYGLTSSIYNDKIYCIGGRESNNYFNINECYNVLTDTWETKLEMPTKRYGLTSNIYNNKIYCIGGYNTSSTNMDNNECYTIESSSYDIQLPDTLGDKLTSIVTDGDGTKVLSDNGTYIDIPKGYRFLTNEEVEEVLSEILD